jgi:hypothetical protein
MTDDRTHAASDRAPASSGGASTAAKPDAAPGPPAWHGAVTIALLYATAAVLITYTLLPLPGQRVFGDGNYWLAGGLFVTHLLASRVVRHRAVRARRGR